MEKAKDWGPAFPHEYLLSDDGLILRHKHDGMSLRDYFAIRIYTTIIQRDIHEPGYTDEKAIEKAFYLADKMLNERNKSQ